MAEALYAGLDLAGLAGCFVAIALIAIIGYLIEQIISAFDFSIFGYNPLHGPLESLRGLINTGIGDAISALEKGAASFESGLLDSLELFIGLTLLLGDAVYLALSKLWLHALAPFVNHVVADIRGDVTGIEQDVTSLYHLTAAAVTSAEHYADEQISAASGALYSILTKEISAAEHAAESYADTAVGKLRSAEDAALAGAVKTLNAGISAAENLAKSEVATAESGASTALAKAEAVFNTAVADVRGIAVGAEDDINTLIGKIGIAGVAGLIGALPALYTLVNTLVQETGLENSSCRSKVKGICGTDPNVWSELLGLLAAAGLALNLRELVKVANDIAPEAVSLVRQAA